jgi:membrane protease YdiL (CAAX protease family)
MSRYRPYLFLLGLNAIPLLGVFLIKHLNLPEFGLDTYGPCFTLVTVALALYSYFRGYSLEDLGMNPKGQGRNILISLVVTAACVAIIGAFFIYNPFGSFRTIHMPTWDWYYLRYTLLFCPFQEFIYRGLIFAELRRDGIRKPWPLILLSTITYSFVHVLFLNGFTLFLTFSIGLIWGYMYWRQKSFWSLAISHAILGTLTIAIGLL